MTLQSTGFRCVAPRYFNIRQMVLSAGEALAVARVDLDRAEATPAQVQHAQKAIAEQGLIAFEDNRMAHCGRPSGGEVGFVACDFYLPSYDAGG